MNCENCGLAEGALTDKGLSMKIVRKAANNFLRDRPTTVWVCCEECAVQAFGVSKYGRATHKWPVTLAQVRATYRRQVKQECGSKQKSNA